MKRKFLHDVSLNTLQVVVVQSCALIIFYLLSTRLTKNEFGEMNWTLAVFLTAFGILALGIDQVAVRRMASGNSPAPLLSTYIRHVLTAGGLFYIVLFTGSILFPSFFQQHRLLLLLGAGKLLLFFSTPFKQLATGLEQFRWLLLMAVTSNILRAAALLVLDGINLLNLHVAVVVFVAGDLAELLVCVFIMQSMMKIPLKLQWNNGDYKSLVKEALPQFGVAVFASALSRLDWIFLAALTGNVILANYSFAYKVFEVATLPMLVMAPLLIPRFTRLFHHTGKIPGDKITDLFVLLRLQVIMASMVALILNILWVTVIDSLTGNRYGAVNQVTILLLSASMPFLYLNNFLWTINFAQGRLKMIFYVFLTSFILNLAGDMVLIPFFNAEGAAMAYSIAIIGQSAIYLRKTALAGLQQNSYRLLICPLAAMAGGFVTTTFFDMLWIKLLLAPAIYLLLLYAARLISFTDWIAFKRVTHL